MGHRRGAETGLIGEAAAGDALCDGGGDRDTEGAAQSRLGTEGTLEDHAENLADVADVGKDHDQCGKDVDDRHHGDDLLRDGANAFNAAEEHQGYDDRHDDADDQVAQREFIAEEGEHRSLHVAAEGVDGGADGLADRLDLRGVSDAEGGEEAEEAEQHAQPAKALSEAVLDIVHRAADPVALVVALTVFDGESDLGKLGAHTDQCGKPHPENGARSADYDCAGDAGDVSCSDGSRQCGGEGLQRRYFTLAGSLLCEHLAEGVLHGMTEFAELQEAGADAENNADAYQQAQHYRAPCNVVQLGYEFADCHVFVLLNDPLMSVSL